MKVRRRRHVRMQGIEQTRGYIHSEYRKWIARGKPMHKLRGGWKFDLAAMQYFKPSGLVVHQEDLGPL